MAGLSYRKGPTKDELRKCVGEKFVAVSIYLCILYFATGELLLSVAVEKSYSENNFLSPPFCRPDFDDDDDEGSKLFRYTCLTLIL